ncbi:MAG: NAD-dependent epimerase/dehydratase family protein [Proteobacteria bacterium]|nr:NAD-dependent epimerase/dehydratase family protein [Pseudomonadota bacterium]
MSKKVLVTGGAGFIGSHVVDRFVDDGYEVHVVDNLSTGSRDNVNEKDEFHNMDIRSEDIAKLVIDIKPDAVVHLAAHIDLRASVESPVMDADINIIGGLRLLDAAVKAGVQHFSFASTAAVYSPEKEIPTPEDTMCVPSSPYGLSKRTFEEYLRLFHALHDLSVAILRFANVYGPRQTVHGEAGVVAIFLNRIKDGKEVTVNGDGEQTRDYVYVEDVARAVYLASDGRHHGTYNVSTGVETSVNDLLARMKDDMGIDMEVVHGPSKAGDDAVSCLSPERAKKELGWSPEVNVKNGLSKTWKSFNQLWKE